MEVKETWVETVLILAQVGLELVVEEPEVLVQLLLKGLLVMNAWELVVEEEQVVVS